MYKEFSIDELDLNVVNLIGKEWMLVTAEKDGKVNSMTASWGGIGVLWGKPVAFVFIRPQRYTKEFVDDAAGFSLSVLPEEYREQLMYFGRTSGRDEDKIAKTGFTVAKSDNIPYFEEADKVFVLKKLYRQEFKEECFIDQKQLSHYPNKDYHFMYVAEIEKVLIKEK